MLPKSQRLTPTLIAKVRRYGQRFENPQFLLMTYKGTPPIKWCIQTPKQVIPKATARNRLRRIISEAIIAVSAQFTTGGYTIIKVKRPLTNLKTQDVTSLLIPLFEKSGLVS